MSYNVDFHIHSYYSDGTMKPTDIVRQYKEKDYDIIALTDHDGVDGVREAIIAGEALKIKVVPGIEFSTLFNFNGEKTQLHILGYYIDIDNEILNTMLKEIRKDRKKRNDELLTLLNDMGYKLTYDDLLERPGQTYIGKPNFARALKRKGYEVADPYEIFDRVEKKKISANGAMKLIKDAGGMAVLAHPMKIKGIGQLRSEEFFDNLNKLVRQLKKDGLKGLECYHPSANEEDSLRLVSIAEKLHLHITEGSDFHEPKESL